LPSAPDSEELDELLEPLPLLLDEEELEELDADFFL
jgi:hypothetical protein